MEKDASLHQGHWQRVRQRALTQETSKFTDKEILELTLQYVYTRGDVNEIASRLLKRFGCFSNVLNASLSELAKVKGVGPFSAQKIILLPKIIDFYNTSMARTQRPVLKCTKHCIDYARKFFKGIKHERLYMFCLNKSYEVIDEILIGKSEEDMVSVSPQELIAKTHELKASFVFLAHNHPNGSVTPSTQDNNFTIKVIKIFSLSDITFLDHIIIGKNDLYFSYRNFGEFTTTQGNSLQTIN